jgi:hypothetical protein
MTDVLAVIKNAVENLRDKVIGLLDLPELQARAIGFGGLTQQCASQHVEVYRAAMVELSQLLIEKWRWVDRNTFLDRWMYYGDWTDYSAQRLRELHLVCADRLRNSLCMIQQQPPEYIDNALLDLSKAWSKVGTDTTFSYLEIRLERKHALKIALLHGLKWLVVTSISTVIGIWIGKHMGKMPG